ncbi:Enoyl-CoA delta isomerase 2, peroxisomal [Melia azedarach]|uniref:Enoyl-CoA delta isomerase 2, peroxisomal n=1 Tax=Melia azedarach TaxID=155640 RepID=A0ACC1YHF8_MELAZ|nr:Enoyl-CoA delta isomerase 2, peroxisomal [Melia azedarach]
MCTLEKRGNLFVLTLTGSSDEHLIDPPFIESILSALSQVKAQATPGSALVTTANGKIFSNGMDLGWVKEAGPGPGVLERLLFLVQAFKPVMAAMISLPMPTIAAVNGDAVATGFLLALSHDYFIMKRHKSILYMKEVDIGISLPDYFTALFRSKVGSAKDLRNIVLTPKKISGEEALGMGFVEAVYDSAEEVFEASICLAKKLEGRKWDGEVYAATRKSTYLDICRMLGVEAQPAVSSDWK